MTEATTLSDLPGKDVALMARYGIRLVPTARFHYKSFRYSNLDDAVRQARRDENTV